MRRIVTLALGAFTVVGALLVVSPREASAARRYYVAPYPYYAYRVAPRYYPAYVPYRRTWGGRTTGAPIFTNWGAFGMGPFGY